MEKKLKQVCSCENCGNEAEMVITCELPDEDTDEDMQHPDHIPKKDVDTPKGKVKGSAVCTHCGNEADMWVDI
jgi:hypothetical protein